MCMTKHFGHEEYLKEGEYKSEECTPEQIRECHGGVLEHLCIKRGDEE